jgi:hypothetical protein
MISGLIQRKSHYFAVFLTFLFFCGMSHLCSSNKQLTTDTDLNCVAFLKKSWLALADL